MAEVTLTFELDVQYSNGLMADPVAEYEVTIPEVETVSAEDLRTILHAAVDEIARRAHAAVNTGEAHHD